MKNIILLITIFGLSIGLKAQNPTDYTIERTDNTPPYINFKNTEGFWHLSGPRSNESGNTNPFSISWNNGTYHRYFNILDNGNIGIGTPSAYSKLHIYKQQDGPFNGLIIDNRKTYGTNSGINETSRIVLSISENGAPNPLTRIFGIMEAGTTSETDSSKGRLSFYVRQNGSAQEKMRITHNGNIGIGTIDTKGFKLGVNGKIAAEEVKVALHDNWPDFVFDNNYKLPKLKDVEHYIQTNGHLKNIPSAETVKENGIYLGDINAKLLQKIEELTLYTIQQQKEIDRLKLIENRLSRIEKLLESKK